MKLAELIERVWEEVRLEKEEMMKWGTKRDHLGKIDEGRDDMSPPWEKR